MKIYDMLINRALNGGSGGGGGGGGGSGDFLTAKITFVTHSATSILPVSYGAVVEDALWYANGLVENTELNVPLYKGIAFMTCFHFDNLNIATTGGVVWDSEEECFIVTGDGTITITDAGGDTQ